MYCESFRILASGLPDLNIDIFFVEEPSDDIAITILPEFPPGPLTTKISMNVAFQAPIVECCISFKYVVVILK